MEKRRLRYSEFGEAPLLLTSSNARAADVAADKSRPQKDEAPTREEACYNDDYIMDEDDDQEKNFMATKPWLGAIYPPKRYIRDEANPHKVFDENYNNWDAPVVNFKLDYVMGYKARDSRDNLHWVDNDTAVFPAAAVGIVFDVKTRDQFFYFGHTDDVVSLDYHRGKQLVASGSIGAGWDCQLCIWSIKDQSNITEIFNLTKIHQFGVVAVNFNPSGTMVCCVGLDEHHSVALVSADTGVVLAYTPADKNRVLHGKFCLSKNSNSETNFVTIGVSHICFWRPSDECGGGGGSAAPPPLPSSSDTEKATATSGNAAKAAASGTSSGTTVPNIFQVTGAPVERRLFWQRGNTSKYPIDKTCALSVEFTTYHTLVGLTDGQVLVFDSASFDCIQTVAATKRSLKELGADPSEVLVNQLRVYSIVRLDGLKTKSAVGESATDTVVVGTAEGNLHFFNVIASSAADLRIEPSEDVTADGQSLDINTLDTFTANEKEYAVNAARSMSWDPTLQQLLVGTSLTTIYILDLRKCMKSKAVFSVLLAGHWGDLKDPFQYGEVWGIDVHPSKQVMISCGDDSTIRLWELKDSIEVARYDVGHKAYKCSFSGDGSMIAVCCRDGGFTILNSTLSAAYVPYRRDRKTCATDISFSPDGKFLALGVEREIDIYSIQRQGAKKSPKTGDIVYDLVTVKREGSCTGHTSLIDGLDWNLTSSLIQTVSIGYEILYFEIPSCDQVTGVKALAEQLWFTQSCTLGWSVQGIWPRYADGSDVNAVAKSRSEHFLTTVDDYGLVKLYNFPCVGSGLDRKTGKLNVRPRCREFTGHSSHVTNVCWTFDDTYCITSGGADLSLFVWEIKYGDFPKPKHFLNAARADKIKPHPALGLVEESPPDQAISGPPVPEPPRPTCYMCDYTFTRDVEQECPRCFASREIPKPVLRKAWRGKEKFLNSHPTSDFIRFVREQRRIMKEEKLQKKARAGGKTPPATPSTVPGGSAPSAMETAAATPGGGAGGVSSRYRQPTQSFARYTKQQQQQRKTVDEAPRIEVSWKPGAVKATSTVGGDIGSDSDEEEISKKIREAAAQQRRKAAQAESSGPASSAPPPKSKKTSGPDHRDY